MDQPYCVQAREAVGDVGADLALELQALVLEVAVDLQRWRPTLFRENPPCAGTFRNGASRTRTGDLLGAMRPLCTRTESLKGLDYQGNLEAALSSNISPEPRGLFAISGVSGTPADECPKCETAFRQRGSPAPFSPRRACGSLIGTDVSPCTTCRAPHAR
jgi:hypothetical protein